MSCTGNVACVCSGRGTVESGPAGATYSVPCPGPPERVQKHGVWYVRDRRRCTCLAGKGTNPSCELHP